MESILQLVHDARNSHGIRHGDWQKYSNFCIKKAARLRSTLGIAQTRSHSFRKVDIRQIEQVEPGHVYLCIFETERTWAQAQIHKSRMRSDKASRARQQYLRKLKRASQHIEATLVLHENISASSSRLTQVELLFFHLIIAASLDSEQRHWTAALEKVIACRYLLSLLTLAFDEPALQALAFEAIDELEPMIRVCLYELNISENADALCTRQGYTFITKLVPASSALLAHLTEKIGSKRNNAPIADSAQIVWKGQTWPIRNATLVKLLPQVNKAEKMAPASLDFSAVENSAPSLATYDNALLLLSEAEEQSRHLVEDNQIALEKTPSENFAALARPLQLAHAYILYEFLLRRISRDTMLIRETLSRQQARENQIQSMESDKADQQPTKYRHQSYSLKSFSISIKLLSGLLQSIDLLKSVSLIEDDAIALSLLDVKASFIRCLRCVYMTQSYIMSQDNLRAAALVERTQQCLRDFTISNDSIPEVTDELAIWVTSQGDIDYLKIQVTANSSDITSTWLASSNTNVKDLSLDSLSINGTITHSVFFDIAFNYVTAFGVPQSHPTLNQAPEQKLLQDTPEAQPIIDKISASDSAAPSRTLWGFFRR